MNNEQTDKTDTAGKENNNSVENSEKPVSIVDEARAIRDEIIKARDSLKAENEKAAKLQAESMLSGTSGGRVETKMVSPEDKKINEAREFFKGTELESAIIKANEKK